MTAEMNTEPAASPFAKPCEPFALLIAAKLVSAEAQVTWAVRFCWVLSLKVPIAVYCTVAPTAIFVDDGVTAMDTSVALVTVMLVLPLTPLAVAVMVTEPAA